jgi:protein TonB
VQPVPQVVNPSAAPIEAPKDIKPEPAAPPSYSMGGVVGGVAGGIPGGSLGGVVGGIAPPPPPPPPAAPVRVGGDIKEPKKIKDQKPVYPQIAQTAKVQGIVIIEATIGKDGSVKDAKVLRSVPLLDQAALDAVRQWKFTPTLLNNVPVEVVMTVTVNFTLN